MDKLILKTLEPGDLIRLRNNKTYIYIRTEKSTVICKPVDGGTQLLVVNKNIITELVSKNADSVIAEIKVALKSLKNGDTIECKDGIYTFLQLKKDQFIASNSEGVYEFTFPLFLKIVEQLGPNSQLTQMKKRIRSYFGKQILTGWGPASVKGFNPLQTHVILYEHDERFDLKLDDFIGQLDEYN
ncbi:MULTISPECIES: hypothetical protein [unclassified Paenibacillus]|uniref:hypothetical protein n=1 Tax=unclassified Paenibacillus TaxID=185978 RepID=UPI002789CBCD|nr:MULTISPECIES: hypothetical protein [unclassified Paenibacillus]MDQ0896349.1 hypothetical protein [Paenibacillus sp. V4I7]MDQ0914108.1 hypothetical protein [Paenibacillus sp. V4I5]